MLLDTKSRLRALKIGLVIIRLVALSMNPAAAFPIIGRANCWIPPAKKRS
ncbi:hypothetical protein [Bradyrhizobium liaoningense]|nr:hypothetical protein [Bradyrhizobium liaoningense]